MERNYRAAKAFFLGVTLLCLLPVIRVRCLSMRHESQRDAIAGKKEKKEMPAGYTARDVSVQGKAMEALAGKGIPVTGRERGGRERDGSGPAILGKYAGLYGENQDLVGWLSIEGMEIDYPVMQNEDDEYYLHHDFYGEDSKYGCLYVRNRADLDGGTNFIIYGHNMKDGSMFGDLDLYLKESFYKEHPVISFDTLYEERTYDIIAVFRSQVYRADDEVFKYYQFYEADTQEEFEDFYDNIKKLSLYDTGVEAAFGDTFLTLSTCAYHVPDGRLVVVAKRRE